MPRLRDSGVARYLEEVRGLRQRLDPVVYAKPGSSVVEWGKSESIDPDNVGDIADEGLGHRG